MLELGDLTTLIRLTGTEVFALQQDIDGPDVEKSNSAAEMIIHTDDLTTKLKQMYEELWDSSSGYPCYEQLVSDYKNYPPFVSNK